MDADCSVELGADDPALEMPWSDPEGRFGYHNLRREPEALLLIDEAMRYRELGGFLAAINSSSSLLETAKCDVWSDADLSEAEEIYEAELKLSSYVDVLFCDDARRFDFATHEALARRTVELLKHAPQVSAAAEFIIRRCWFHDDQPGSPRDGFYFTVYVSGYGDDEDDAHRRWGVGLLLVQNALLQVSAEMMKKS